MKTTIAITTTPNSKEQKSLFHFKHNWLLNFGLSIECRNAKRADVTSV